MFRNIGKKIKTLAKVLCWIGIVLSVLTGVGILLVGVFSVQLGAGAGAAAGVSIAAGVATMIIGSLLSWIGSFLVYGFGELIDKSTETAENTRKIAEQTAPKPVMPRPVQPAPAPQSSQQPPMPQPPQQGATQYTPYNNYGGTTPYGTK